MKTILYFIGFVIVIGLFFLSIDILSDIDKILRSQDILYKKDILFYTGFFLPIVLYYFSYRIQSSHIRFEQIVWNVLFNLFNSFLGILFFVNMLFVLISGIGELKNFTQAFIIIFVLFLIVYSFFYKYINKAFSKIKFTKIKPIKHMKLNTIFVFLSFIISIVIGFWFKIPNKELTNELMYSRAEWKKELRLQQLQSESFFLGEHFDFNWRMSIPFFIMAIICLVVYNKLVKNKGLNND